MQPLNDDTPVKLVNLDPVPYDCAIRPAAAYGPLTTYRLNPGATAFWTWRVAKHLLGDPTVGNENGELDAEREYAHDNFGRVYSPESYTPPNIEVYDMEGNRIQMAIETQPGTEHLVTTGIGTGELEARMAQLQAEIDILRGNVSSSASPPAAITANPPQPEVTDPDSLPLDDTATPAPRLSGQPRDTPLRAAELGLDLPVDQ